jgi:hypothetical protein
MDEAENVCCASKRVQQQGSPDPDPMHACSGSAQQGPPDCEEKRDPRERPTADQLTELDPRARLEKRTLPPLQDADIRATSRNGRLRAQLINGAVSPRGEADVGKARAKSES